MNAKAAEEDPLAQLGYGITAYINILNTFIWVFVLFSLLLIPTMQAFSSGDAYEGDPLAGKATGMLSNLGYSTMECKNIPLSLGNVVLDCPYGTIGKIFDYGVNNPDRGSPIDACQTNDINRTCKPSSRLLDALNTGIGKDRKNVNFSSANDSSCSGSNLQLYVQYSCI